MSCSSFPSKLFLPIQALQPTSQSTLPRQVYGYTVNHDTLLYLFKHACMSWLTQLAIQLQNHNADESAKLSLWGESWLSTWSLNTLTRHVYCYTVQSSSDDGSGLAKPTSPVQFSSKNSFSVKRLSELDDLPYHRHSDQSPSKFISLRFCQIIAGMAQRMCRRIAMKPVWDFSCQLQSCALTHAHSSRKGERFYLGHVFDYEYIFAIWDLSVVGRYCQVGRE